MSNTKIQKSSSWTPQIQKKSPSLAPPPIVVQRDPVSGNTEAPMPEYTPLEPNALENHPLMRKSSDLPPIQTKLTIGAPGDKYEQEADTIARKVVHQINSPVAQRDLTGETGAIGQLPTKILSRKPSGRNITVSPFAGMLQGKEAVGGGEASSEIESSINSAKGGGQSLDPGLQRSMGQAMGADFSGVRVHTDGNADTLNRSMSARAFTTGNHVFFKSGEYNPGSQGGQELIAHELTHVVQQNASGTIARKLTIVQRSTEVDAVKKASLDAGYAGDERVVPTSRSAKRYPLEGKMLPGEFEIEDFIESNYGEMLSGLKLRMSDYPYITEAHYEAYCEELMRDTQVNMGARHFSERVMADSAPKASYVFYPSHSTKIYSIHVSKGGKIFTLCPKSPVDMKMMKKISGLQTLANKKKLVSRFGEHDFVHSGSHLRGAPVESNMHIHQGGFGIEVSGKMVQNLINKLRKYNFIDEQGKEEALQQFNW